METLQDKMLDAIQEQTEFEGTNISGAAKACTVIALQEQLELLEHTKVVIGGLSDIQSKYWEKVCNRIQEQLKALQDGTEPIS